MSVSLSNFTLHLWQGRCKDPVFDIEVDVKYGYCGCVPAQHDLATVQSHRGVASATASSSLRYDKPVLVELVGLG